MVVMRLQDSENVRVHVCVRGGGGSWGGGGIDFPIA